MHTYELRSTPHVFPLAVWIKSRIWRQINFNGDGATSPFAAICAHFSRRGTTRVLVHSEGKRFKNQTDYFSRENEIRGNWRKRAPRGGGRQLLTNPSDDKALHNCPVNLYLCDHRARELMHAGISFDIQSQYSWGGRVGCGCGCGCVCVCVCVCRGEVDVEPTEISPLHHWVNGTTDVSCDFTAASWRVTLKPTHEHIAHQSEWGVLCFRCLCRGKNNGRPPPPPQVHTCTPGMSRMSGDGNERGEVEGVLGGGDPFGFLHLSRET